jgi:hypothetical protein
MLVKTRIATYTCSRLGTISPTRSTFTSATSAYLGRGTLFHHLLMSVGRKNNSNIWPEDFLRLYCTPHNEMDWRRDQNNSQSSSQGKFLYKQERYMTRSDWGQYWCSYIGRNSRSNLIHCTRLPHAGVIKFRPDRGRVEYLPCYCRNRNCLDQYQSPGTCQSSSRAALQDTFELWLV